MSTSDLGATGPSVVCGVDFSRGSAAALRYAVALASRTGSHVVVVHVQDPLLEAASEAAGDRRGFTSTLESELKAFVRQVLGRRARMAATRVLVGDAHQEVMRLAAAVKASAIVLGTRGLGGPGALFLGSTADRVLRSAVIPVLAVPPAAAAGAAARIGRGWPRRVLAAIEPGIAMRRDVRAAFEATAWLGVTPVPITVVAAGASAPAISRALDVLGAAVRAVAPGGAREIRVRSGDPVDELVIEASSAPAGLVIARRRASRGLFHLLRRSTTARALPKLSVPLLVLPDSTSWIRRLRRTARS